GVRLEARPAEDVVHGVGELALRVGIVRGIHQDVVAQHAGDVVEELLTLMPLDGAEEAPAGQVLAGPVLEGRYPADIGGLLVHALGPEGKPAESALENPHAQAGVAVQDAGPDEGGHETHAAPRMGGQAAEEDVVPQVLVAGEVRWVPGVAVMDDG